MRLQAGGLDAGPAADPLRESSHRAGERTGHRRPATLTNEAGDGMPSVAAEVGKVPCARRAAGKQPAISGLAADDSPGPVVVSGALGTFTGRQPPPRPVEAGGQQAKSVPAVRPAQSGRVPSEVVALWINQISNRFCWY